MDPLRWRYKLKVDVEETAANARTKGFSVGEREGETKNCTHFYPLNQIVIRNGDFPANVKALVSPQVTQVYFFIKYVPSIEEFEKIVKDLERAEQALNDMVVFAHNETTRFSISTEIPVLSHSMLKAQQKVTSGFHKIMDQIQETVLNEITRTFQDLAHGKIPQAISRIEQLLNELTSMHRNLVQLAKEQGKAEVGNGKKN